MKTLDYIKFNDADANNIVELLNLLLADLQIHYTNLRSLHWNIQGESFFELHDQFEEMYNGVADKVDEVAERILMLGGVPENKFSVYLKSARIKEVASITESKEAINNILQSVSHLIKEERKIVVAAAEFNDEVTVALMSDYLIEQEKMIWMLTAYNK